MIPAAIYPPEGRVNDLRGGIRRFDGELPHLNRRLSCFDFGLGMRRSSPAL